MMMNYEKCIVAAWRFFWGCGISTISTAAFLFSLGTLAVRFLEGDGPDAVPAFQVACIPSGVCWLVLSGIMFSQKEFVLAPSRTVRLLTILRGLFGAGSLMLYYLSIEMLPLKDAVTLFFCSPVIAVILEWMVVGDYPSSSSMVGCLFTVAGVFLVTQPAGMDHMAQPRAGMSLGMICALLAATCNAVAFVIVRALGGRQSAITLTWWYHLVVCGVTAVPLVSKYPVPAVWPNRVQTLLLAAVVATQFAGQILLNRGFSLVSATRGSAINVLQVVFSYLWELTILREDMNLVSVAGGACVVAGVLAVALSGWQQSMDTGTIEPDVEPGRQVTYVLVPTADTGGVAVACSKLETASNAGLHTRPGHGCHLPPLPPAQLVALAGGATGTSRRSGVNGGSGGGGSKSADNAVLQPLLVARSSLEGDVSTQSGSPWSMHGQVVPARGTSWSTGAGTNNLTQARGHLFGGGDDAGIITRHSFDVAAQSDERQSRSSSDI